MIYSQEYGKRPNLVEFEAIEQVGGTWGAAYLWSLGNAGGGSPSCGGYLTKEDAIIGAATSFLVRFGSDPEYATLCEYARECRGSTDQLDLFGGL
jgi:hypothetical protein